MLPNHVSGPKINANLVRIDVEQTIKSLTEKLHLDNLYCALLFETASSNETVNLNTLITPNGNTDDFWPEGAKVMLDTIKNSTEPFVSNLFPQECKPTEVGKISFSGLRIPCKYYSDGTERSGILYVTISGGKEITRFAAAFLAAQSFQQSVEERNDTKIELDINPFENSSDESIRTTSFLIKPCYNSLI